MVKTPNPVMSLSHGTRLGLAGILKGLSKDVVAHNVTVNQLLPERFDTGRQEQMAQLVMQFKGVSYEDARAEQIQLADEQSLMQVVGLVFGQE